MMAKPTTLQDPAADTEVKNVQIFCNGNRFAPGKHVVVNTRQIRNFGTFLDELTRILNPLQGAIRRLYTPVNGNPVMNTKELQEGAGYVAAGKEKFKRLNYFEIQPLSPRRTKGPKFPYFDIKPVTHSQFRVSGKVKKINIQSKKIVVFPNGQFFLPPSIIVLTQTEQTSMDTIMHSVGIKVDLPQGGFPERLYTLDGVRVDNTEKVTNGTMYVAATHREKFKPGPYGPYMRMAPIKGRVRPINHVRPPGGDIKKESDKDLTARFPSRLTPINKKKFGQKGSDSEQSQENSTSSDYSSSKRSRKSRATTREAENGVFHVRQVRHKRSPEKPPSVKQPDYDKDQGGLFKAKDKNPETKNAIVVSETAQTKVDLPVDTMAAQEIKEETLNVPEEEASFDTSRMRDEIEYGYSLDDHHEKISENHPEEDPSDQNVNETLEEDPSDQNVNETLEATDVQSDIKENHLDEDPSLLDKILDDDDAGPTEATKLYTDAIENHPETTDTNESAPGQTPATDLKSDDASLSEETNNKESQPENGESLANDIVIEQAPLEICLSPKVDSDELHNEQCNEPCPEEPKDIQQEGPKDVQQGEPSQLSQDMSPEQPQQLSPEPPQQMSSEQPQQMSPEQPQQLSPDEPQQLSPEPQQMSPEQSQQLSPEKPQQMSPEQPEQMSPEELQQMSPEQPLQMSPEQPQQMSPEEPQQMSPEQPHQMSPEQPQQFSPEGSQQMSPGESKEESQPSSPSVDLDFCDSPKEAISETVEAPTADNQEAVMESSNDSPKIEVDGPASPSVSEPEKPSEADNPIPEEQPGNGTTSEEPNVEVEAPIDTSSLGVDTVDSNQGSPPENPPESPKEIIEETKVEVNGLPKDESNESPADETNISSQNDAADQGVQKATDAPKDDPNETDQQPAKIDQIEESPDVLWDSTEDGSRQAPTQSPEQLGKDPDVQSLENNPKVNNKEETNEDGNNKNDDEAAPIIQAHYRDYPARKDVENDSNTNGHRTDENLKDTLSVPVTDTTDQQ